MWPTTDLFHAANLLNVSDANVATVLDVPVAEVTVWHYQRAMPEDLAPAFAALLEAAWTKSYVDFDRANGTRAVPFRQQLLDMRDVVAKATDPIKAQPALKAKYLPIMQRMLEALGRADHKQRITPRQRGVGRG